MIKIRKSKDRGFFENDWLKSFHSFSFDTYFDPNYTTFGPLRVLNHDFVKSGYGFGTHGHRDMEIITYVLNGEISHQDSLGNKIKVPAGDIQRMTAGSGIQHSEHNLSKSDLELFQIWILPDKKSLPPGYEQKTLDQSQRKNRFQLIVSPDAKDNSLKIHNDVRVFATRLDAGKSLERELDPNRLYWLQLASGKTTVNDQTVVDQDALSFQGESKIVIVSESDTEFLLFDLPR